MSSPAHSRSDWASSVREITSSRILLWIAFVLVHLWLGLVNLHGPGLPLGDVSYVYKFWTDQAIVSHYWVGIDGSWVYPIVALVPMLMARAFGPELYSSTWLSLAMVLDAVALAFIVGWGRQRRHVAVGWWWVLFLLLLGPIALGRIDSITVPLAIVGMLQVAKRPGAAAALLTIATWIKVWPAALLAAIVIAVRSRLRVVAVSVATSVAIVLAALALGAGSNVFSFVGQQTARGLQVEAPVSTIWLWAGWAHVPNTYVYYDQVLLTWQVRGPGVSTASGLMTPLLALVLVGVVIVALLAMRRGARSLEVLPALSLAFVCACIAVNKVGSPQYITWLAVPVILGLVTRLEGHGRSFRTPAIIVLVLAVLTQAIYPYLYGYLIGLNTVMLLVLSARNLLYFVLLVWSVVAVWRAPGLLGDRWFTDSTADAAVPPVAVPPVVWPFSAGKKPADRHGAADGDRLDPETPTDRTT
ncbi:glycosyltransferase 87 family protein [Lacisediminihabitans sp.]|jgi:hypothetical protein|uniref:glycosyltransferase 87 family protein n=1 Tax=Lacisediminihabitans sp. TaxID=2787631 RepID=UPI002F93762F